MLKKLIKKSFQTIIFLVTLYALYQLVIFLHKKVPYPFSIVLFIFIGLIILFPFLLGVKRPLLFRLFKIPVSGRVSTITKNYQIKIDSEGKARVRVKRTMIFSDMPESWELVDLFSVDKHMPINSFIYESPDAIEIKRKGARHSKIKIYWKPKSRVKVLTPYEHIFGWIPPTSFNDPGNYIELYPDNPAGYQELLIEVNKKIEYAVAFKKTKGKYFRREKDIYKYALTMADTECPQPRISEDGLSFSLEMEEPERGAIYFIAFFYEGGVQHWKSELGLT